MGRRSSELPIDAEWREISTRWPVACAECETDLPRRRKIVWQPDTKLVLCLTCAGTLGVQAIPLRTKKSKSKDPRPRRARKKSGNKGFRLAYTRSTTPKIRTRQAAARAPRAIKVTYADGTTQVLSPQAFAKRKRRDDSAAPEVPSPPTR